MSTLLIATRNKGKLKELSDFLSDLKLKIVSLLDLKIKEDVVEDKKTYRANSQKKALYFARLSGLPTIADDGGIEIDALDGAPGIKSKRWLGPNSTEEDIIKHMIHLAKTLPDHKRTAHFKAVVSFALPDGRVWSRQGEIKGMIAKKPLSMWLKGYPYRSFFYLPKIKKYYHEKDLTEQEARLYNHRYKAIVKLTPTIKNALNRYDSKKQG
jgi:XTP/dITP diphosphohydrolase